MGGSAVPRMWEDADSTARPGTIAPARDSAVRTGCEILKAGPPQRAAPASPTDSIGCGAFLPEKPSICSLSVEYGISSYFHLLLRKILSHSSYHPLSSIYSECVNDIPSIYMQ